MFARLTTFALLAFLLAGALMAPEPVHAATANASAGVTIISPAEVTTTAATELLQNASTGVLTLSIPGAGGVSGSGSEAAVEMTLTSTGVPGSSVVFSTTDSSGLTSLIQGLAESGGSFGSNGVMSAGQGVSLSVTSTVQNANGRGTVYVVVSYN